MKQYVQDIGYVGMIVIEGVDSMRAIYSLYGTPIAILLPQLEAVQGIL